jgi:hypothetical protein
MNLIKKKSMSSMGAENLNDWMATEIWKKS